MYGCKNEVSAQIAAGPNCPGLPYIYCGSEQYMYEMELQNEQWLKDGRVIQDCIFGNILMPACKCRVSDV